MFFSGLLIASLHYQAKLRRTFPSPIRAQQIFVDSIRRRFGQMEWHHEIDLGPRAELSIRPSQERYAGGLGGRRGRVYTSACYAVLRSTTYHRQGWLPFNAARRRRRDDDNSTYGTTVKSNLGLRRVASLQPNRYARATMPIAILIIFVDLRGEFCEVLDGEWKKIEQCTDWYCVSSWSKAFNMLWRKIENGWAVWLWSMLTCGLGEPEKPKEKVRPRYFSTESIRNTVSSDTLFMGEERDPEIEIQCNSRCMLQLFPGAL